MSVSQKFKSDAHIHARREYEFKEARLQNAIKGDKNLFLKAKWEEKTDNVIKKNIIRDRIKDIKRRQETDVVQRRKKLAQLLAAEDQQYEAEFLASQETPEQVRQKMADRLNELQSKREQERLSTVQQALDRKFKMETDDLRKEETNFMVAGCQLEREKQLMDKRQKMEQAILEEQVYAKLWMLDGEKKIARERREAEEKKKKNSETLNILNWQTEQRKTVQEIEQEKRLKEQEMLKRQWVQELAQDKEAERQKFILNRERNLELINHNAAERELRAIQAESDKQRDRDMLAQILAHQEAVERLEEEEKLKRRSEIVELQKYYKQTQSDKAAYEKLVDEFVAQEAERQFKMREAQWQRQEQARINLLKDVYVSRENDILLKQAQKQEKQWLRDHEKQMIEAAIAQQNQEYEARVAKEVAAKKNHQTDILRQMNEKDRIQRTYLQEKMYEERAAKLAELEYQRKINVDKAQNATMLSQWKQSVQY